MSNAISYAKFSSRSRDAVICVYEGAGNVIEARVHERVRGALNGLAILQPFDGYSLYAARNRLQDAV